MKKRFSLINIVMMGIVVLSFTGCFADKALLGIDIEHSKKVTQELTKPIVLKGKIPQNLTGSEKHRLLSYAITNIPYGYRHADSNTGYRVTERAKYYCKYAHRKFEKVYRYEIEYAPDNRSIIIKNQSYCPICFNSGDIRTLKKEKKLCPFDQPTGKKIVKKMQNIREIISTSLYDLLVDFSTFKEKMGEFGYIYDGYFYYKDLKDMDDALKIQRTKEYLIQKKQEADKAFEAEEEARALRVQMMIEKYKKENHISGIRAQQQCSTVYNLSIAQAQQKTAIGKGIGAGLALGEQHKHPNFRPSPQEAENFCIKELNIRSLDCVTYKSALQSCKAKFF